MASSSSTFPLFNELCDDDTEEQMIALFWNQMAHVTILMNEVERGGSRPGKTPNLSRDYAAVHAHYKEVLLAKQH